MTRVKIRNSPSLSGVFVPMATAQYLHSHGHHLSELEFDGRPHARRRAAVHTSASAAVRRGSGRREVRCSDPRPRALWLDMHGSWGKATAGGRGLAGGVARDMFIDHRFLTRSGGDDADSYCREGSHLLAWEHGPKPSSRQATALIFSLSLSLSLFIHCSSRRWIELAL
jgi:hypothetical protein